MYDMSNCFNKQKQQSDYVLLQIKIDQGETLFKKYRFDKLTCFFSYCSFPRKKCFYVEFKIIVIKQLLIIAHYNII